MAIEPPASASRETRGPGFSFSNHRRRLHARRRPPSYDRDVLERSQQREPMNEVAPAAHRPATTTRRRAAFIPGHPFGRPDRRARLDTIIGNPHLRPCVPFAWRAVNRQRGRATAVLALETTASTLRRPDALFASAGAAFQLTPRRPRVLDPDRQQTRAPAGSGPRIPQQRISSRRPAGGPLAPRPCFNGVLDPAGCSTSGGQNGC